MQAIILAGGFGTRLQSVVSDVPKPMAPIGEIPFLEYLLDDLSNQGFQRVVLAVGYKKEIIENYFGNSFKNMKIIYSIEDEPLGTGGCIKKAMSYIEEDFAFILNGDTMFKIDFNEMAKLNTLAIACKKMRNFDRYGEVKIKNNTIIKFSEKKYVEEGYINGGIYYMPKNIFDEFDLPQKFSLEKDFFEKYINVLNIKTFLSEDYFIDIGIPEDYAKAQNDLKKKALFLDRDGIINEDYGHVHKIEDFKFCEGIFELCKDYQRKGYLLFIITNQAGIGKGLYKEEDFLTLNTWMLKQFEQKDIPITKVYYCPHKPEDNCNCRKPKSGLFVNAIKEFNLNPEKCVAIGDKMSDLEAAYNAGIQDLYFKKTKYEEYEVKFNYKRLD